LTRPRARCVVPLDNSGVPPEYAWSRKRDHIIDSAPSGKDQADIEGLSIGRWTDEHRDRALAGLEGSTVMSKCVQHVVIVDAVLAGARLDVDADCARSETPAVNIC